MNEQTKVSFLSSLWSFLKHPITTLVIGAVVSGVLSWYISLYFYNKSLSIEVAAATQKGEDDGRHQGQLAAEADLRANMPRYLEQRYPDELKARHDLGYAEGKEAGIAVEKAASAASHDAGYAQGRKDGYQAALQDTAAQRKAADEWRVFAAAVTTAGKAAAALRQKGDPDSERKFFDAVGSLISNAETLNRGFSSKAKAFDSTVDEIAKALADKDYDRVLQLTVDLNNSLPARTTEFFGSDTTIQNALDNVTKIEWPKL